MKFEVERTRAFYESAPQFKTIQHILTPVASVAINCKTYREGSGDIPPPDSVAPEAEALEFYGLNHLSALVKSKFTLHERLPDWADNVMKAYMKCLTQQGRRLFFYTLLVTTRESRHLKNASTLKADVIAKFGEGAYQFNQSIKGSSSDGAANKFQSDPPDSTLGPYVESLEYIFFNGSFSGGYGGKPWGNIAATLRAFVLGQTSLEMMVDTAYTLAHNNGPMFNKGMLYNMYTHNFYRVLDVQRSGQIPELILNMAEDGKGLKVDPGLRAIIAEVNEITNAFGSYVDWHKVEALGSLHKYPSEKAQQDKKHPKPAEPPKAAEVKKGFENHTFTQQWDVFPGQKVNMYVRGATA